MNTRKMLVVDDEPALIDLIRDVAESLGYEALVAENGAVALELLKHHKPELILCDLNLPDLSGTKICEIVKSLRPEPRMILMTGEIGADAKTCSGILRKPFGLKELADAIALGQPEAIER